MRQLQSYLVPFSLRVAFAEILPKPSHPISLPVFMLFFDSHHWCFIILCITSACNKLPGGCSQAHTHLAHAHRRALSLLHPNYGSHAELLLKCAHALLSDDGHSSLPATRSFNRQRGHVTALCRRRPWQPDTRLTPRGHMTKHRPILLGHLRMRSTPLPNSITVSWEDVNDHN